MSHQKPKNTVWSKYGYLWTTLTLFVFSLAGHWIFGWYAFVNEQAEYGQAPEMAQFVVQAMRDTLENWQSEFLQLIWQVSGLALLYHIGSPQSKEGYAAAYNLDPMSEVSTTKWYAAANSCQHHQRLLRVRGMRPRLDAAQAATAEGQPLVLANSETP